MKTNIIASGESKKEATGRNLILNALNKKGLGFRDKRIMYESRKLAQFKSEISQYNIMG